MNISFRIDWLDLFAVHGTLKSLLQHHNSKASILQRSAFSMFQLSHPYTTTGKTIALSGWIFVGKVISLLFNMLSRLVISSLPRSKWPQEMPVFSSYRNYKSGYITLHSHKPCIRVAVAPHLANT